MYSLSELQFSFKPQISFIFLHLKEQSDSKSRQACVLSQPRSCLCRAGLWRRFSLSELGPAGAAPRPSGHRDLRRSLRRLWFVSLFLKMNSGAQFKWLSGKLISPSSHNDEPKLLQEFPPCLRPRAFFINFDTGSLPRFCCFLCLSLYRVVSSFTLSAAYPSLHCKSCSHPQPGRMALYQR